MNDVINGLFELIGGCLLMLNVRRLWRDRKVVGVSLWPVVFYTAWGFWNLYFYPSVKAPWSFWGAITVVTANASWLLLYVWISKEKQNGN